MEFKQFKKMAQMMGVIAVAANLTGCGKVINEGDFGIERHWGGSYNQEPLNSGFHFNFFDTIFPVTERNILLTIPDATPKDANKVALRDLDLNITYRVNKLKAIPFILKNADMVEENGHFVIGKAFITKEAQSAIGDTVKKFTSEEILIDKDKVEKAFQADFQKKLDEEYGKDTFIIAEVRFSNILVAQSVEQKIQAIALVNSENEKNRAIALVLESREKTMTREAQALRRAADNGGITVDQILNYEMIKAIREGNVEHVQVAVPAKSETKPKP